MSLLLSDQLWERYVAARDGEPELGVFPGELWNAWFHQCCVEGRDPSALKRHSTNLDEKIDARSLPAPGGCLVWDGKINRDQPRCSHREPGAKRETDVHVRNYVLKRAGREIPYKRRCVALCGTKTCVNPDHLGFEDEPWTRLSSDEQIIGRVQALALRLGHSPTSIEWKAADMRPVRTMICARFGSWKAFLAKAGLPPCTRSAFVSCEQTDEEMLASLREYHDTHGRAPRYDEWNAQPDKKASATTYHRRFGSWSEAKRKAGLT